MAFADCDLALSDPSQSLESACERLDKVCAVINLMSRSCLPFKFPKSQEEKNVVFGCAFEGTWPKETTLHQFDEYNQSL